MTPSPDRYDIVIAGGGAAGLSLAYHLMLSPLRNRSILIVDKDDDDQLQRNWGFWTNRPTLFDALAHHTWHELEYVSPRVAKTLDLGGYRYVRMRGADFYRFALQQLAACPNVSFLRGVIERVEDGETAATVVVDGQAITTEWAFDSLVRSAEMKRATAGSQFLRMHFKGWEIETACLAFNPQSATLFDFRVPQQNAAQDAMRFFYVLPFSETRALVEYTLFSAGVLRQDEYECALREHIGERLGIRDYQVVMQENGVVPITDYAFPRHAGRRVMTIGTKAGRVKPSTGYSFLRIQDDSAAIVRSLLKHGHPFDVPADPPFYRLCDALLLQIMLRDGGRVAPIFDALFTRNPAPRIFRFLDQVAAPVEVLALMGSLPCAPFLKALARHVAR
jgi:lycopene beta-cyclase